jgi:hypothetical protein
MFVRFGFLFAKIATDGLLTGDKEERDLVVTATAHAIESICEAID